MLDTIKSFFRERLDFAKSKGILKKQIVLDPEMVFFSGATKYSFVFLWRISELYEFDLSLLSGTSRSIFSCRCLWGILNLLNATSLVRLFPVNTSSKDFHFFAFMKSSRDVS